MHIHLFEFTDQPWFPQILRQYVTDYLHFVIINAGIYKPAILLIQEVIDKTGTGEILDLCSGSGGGVDIIQKELSKITGKNIKLTMSDKFPNPGIYEQLKKNSNGGLEYINESVDVMNVPKKLKGIRTLFSAFHHFKPEYAREIIKDSVRNNTPICIFEGAGKTVLDFFGILIFTPVIFFIITPFMKPFRFSRLFLTYVIPIVPLTTLWDGLVSILRMHTPKDMLKMANEIDTGGKFVWKAGQIKGKFGNRVMFMTGYPENKS